MDEAVRRGGRGTVARLEVGGAAGVPQDALDAALAETGMRALVLAGDWGFAAPDAAPETVAALSALCDRIELSHRPVIAALTGDVLGGGLELALAAHVRLADRGARFGWPGLAWGRVPGAGGTQRAPRLIGAEAALALLLEGDTLDAAEALALGLIDAVVDDDVQVAAEGLADDMAADRRPPQRTRDRTEWLRDPTRHQAAVTAARTAVAGARLPAPGRIVDCIEAALLLPFEQGLLFERAAFDDLAAGPEAAGLAHLMRSEDRLRAETATAATLGQVGPGQVGIVGLGRDGAGMALALIAAGLPVVAAEADREALIGGLGRIAEMQERAVAAGHLTVAARDADWSRLVPAADLTGLAGCIPVIDALDDDDPAKPGVLAELAAILPQQAVIATTTTWGDLAALAGAMGREDGMIGLRLAPPAPGPRVVEVATGPATRTAARACGQALAQGMGRLALRTTMAPGGVGPRLLETLRLAADYLLEDGATPGGIDAALESFGFVRGPYGVLDAAGLDRVAGDRARAAALRGDGARQMELADLLIAAGRFGQDSGGGYLDHAPGRAPQDSPEVLALLAELRAAKGIVARRIGADEVRRRCLAAMANDGARMLGEGVVARPSDIDLVAMAACGFPRWEGGPMFGAARRGLLVVRADLRGFADQAPEFWQVAPLIDRLIREGRGLADLEGPGAV